MKTFPHSHAGYLRKLSDMKQRGFRILFDLKKDEYLFSKIKCKVN